MGGGAATSEGHAAKTVLILNLADLHAAAALARGNMPPALHPWAAPLERLFARYLGRSPKRYYTEARLAKARGLLMQTDMTVIEVALACGFSSPSHFSKCYRAQYGATPYRERGTGGRAA